MTDPDPELELELEDDEESGAAPANPGRSIAVYALIYVAVVAMSVPALSVFTDPQIAALVWIAGAITFYALSWRLLVTKKTDYLRGFLVLGMTIVVGAVAYFTLLAVWQALGFSGTK